MTLSEIDGITDSVKGTGWSVQVIEDGKAVGVKYEHTDGSEFTVWIRDSDGVQRVDSIAQYAAAFSKAALMSDHGREAGSTIIIIRARLNQSILAHKLLNIYV